MIEKTVDIIKILPFDETLKQELIEKFDKLDNNKQIVITEMLWEIYDTLYDIKFNQNLQVAFAKIAEGKETLAPDLENRVREQTRNEMTEEDVKEVDEADLDAARKAMELIVKEMKAAKMPIKAD